MQVRWKHRPDTNEANTFLGKAQTCLIETIVVIFFSFSRVFWIISSFFFAVPALKSKELVRFYMTITWPCCDSPVAIGEKNPDWGHYILPELVAFAAPPPFFLGHSGLHLLCMWPLNKCIQIPAAVGLYLELGLKAGAPHVHARMHFLLTRTNSRRGKPG